MDESKLFNNIIQPKTSEQQKKLSPEEIHQLGEEMNKYEKGLLDRIKEIEIELESGVDDEGTKKLHEELEFLKEQAAGLQDFSDDITEGNYDSVIEKPINEDNK